MFPYTIKGCPYSWRFTYLYTWFTYLYTWFTYLYTRFTYLYTRFTYLYWFIYVNICLYWFILVDNWSTNLSFVDRFYQKRICHQSGPYGSKSNNSCGKMTVVWILNFDIFKISGPFWPPGLGPGPRSRILIKKTIKNS